MLLLQLQTFLFRNKKLFDSLVRRIHSSNNDFIFGSIEQKGFGGMISQKIF